MALIENPDLDVEALMQFVPGPDFPTAAFIHGKTAIREAYTTGRGILQLRARAGIETEKRTGRVSIIVTEIPYQVNKAKLIENIAELVNEKRIDGISDLRDESDREGMRIVIELKKDAVPEIVLNQLYKLTPMQESFGIIMLAIVDGRPKLLTLKDALKVLHRAPPRRGRPAARSSSCARPRSALHILDGLQDRPRQPRRRDRAHPPRRDAGSAPRRA